MTAKILVIDDEATLRNLIKGRLERRGYKVFEAAEGAEAIEKYHSLKPDLAISDIRMPKFDGFEVMAALKIPVILITGHGDKESAIKAVEMGAFGFFEKPFDLDQLEISIKRGLEKHRLLLEREELLKRLAEKVEYQERELVFVDSKQSTKMIGINSKIEEVRRILERLVLKPKATLLVLGETGTGKEVVARELHSLTHGTSARSSFLALNCASIPSELFESELYGHEKGSFTGALQPRIGLAEAVGEGTLFLDEVGELEARHQAKLLRLLQERTFRRVGANRELQFKGRIVAATHKNLKDKDKFREDLFYRLSTVNITLPPLRERREDLGILIESLCKKHGLSGVSPERLAELCVYPWPGNIRELNNWIERAAILGLHDHQGLITDIAPNEGPPSALSPLQSSFDVTQLPKLKDYRKKLLDEGEKKLIEAILIETNYNISVSSKILGIDRKNLARRIAELGLKEPKGSKKAA